MLFNVPFGNWDVGERGIAYLPERETEFHDGFARALEYAEPAVELARQLRDRVREAAALIQLGETYNLGGEPRRALRTFEKALAAAQRGSVKPLIALSSWRLAQNVEQSGNERAALKYYEQCLAALDPAAVSDPTPAQVQAKIAALRG